MAVRNGWSAIVAALCVVVVNLQGAHTAPKDEADVCELPKAPGPCRAFIPSFFYDSKSGKCEKFVYGGCRGNGNRFETQQECEKKCVKYPEPELAVCEFPEPEIQIDLQEAIKAEADVCKLPKVTGRCRAYFPSYYFNSKSGKCEKFVYGGCGGNGNRFKTQEECEKKCVKHPEPQIAVCPFPEALIPTLPEPEEKDICLMPKVEGPCEAYIPSFYYNARHGKCEPFVYGGCHGNGNKFASQQECEKRCAGHVKPAIKPIPRPSKPVKITQKKNVCQLPKATGTCRAYIPSYYFNSKSGKCEKFVYGGCRGNDNRFKTLRDCRRKCGRKNRRRQRLTYRTRTVKGKYLTIDEPFESIYIVE